MSLINGASPPPGLNPNPGRKNIYTCQECGGHLITKDLVPGTTPFIIACQVTHGCPGRMQSSMYRVFDPDDKLGHTHEWYKPILTSAMSPSTMDHVRKGGLLLRAITGQLKGAAMLYRHKKNRKTYRLITEALLQASAPVAENDLLVIYENEEGQTFARAKKEFDDGRFEHIKS